MRHLSLFSGIGGIDLAAHWAGIETVAFCECETFPQKVLRKNFPGVPIYDDVRTLSREVLERDQIIRSDQTIDIISAGYPCQPFSTAGQRRGAEDDRHLWPEVARLLREIRPHWFIGENVAGHISLGLDDVLTELADIGYDAQAFVVPASAIYASHRRDRVFIVGYTERGGCGRESRGRTRKVAADGHLQCTARAMADTDGDGDNSETKCRANIYRQESMQGWQKPRSRPCDIGQNVAHAKSYSPSRLSIGEKATYARSACSGQDVADSSGARQQEQHATNIPIELGLGTGSINENGTLWTAQSRLGGDANELPDGLDRRGIATLDALSEFIHSYPQPALMGQPQHDWEPPRVAVGVKNRVARLKAIGNAVDPLQIYPILAAIKFIDQL